MKRIKIASMLVAVALLAGCAAPAARNPQVSQTNPTHIDNGAAPGQSGQPRGTQGSKEDGQVKGQDVFLLYEPENAAVLAAGEVGGNTRAGELAARINEFSGQLISLVDDGDKNFVFSPFSVYMALASLSNGAVDSSYEQLRDALYPQGMDKEQFNKACADLNALLTYRKEKETGSTSGDPKDALVIELASLIVTDNDYTLNSDFALRARESFLADTAIADFADPTVMDFVNEWADEATHGLIPQIIAEPIDPMTAVLLANSIYFSGKWLSGFSKDATEQAVFHGTSGDGTVSMMKKEGNQLYFENDMLQATRQAYYGGAYMDIYLPKEGYALDDVLGSLNSLSPQFQTADGTLKLPRFTTDYGKGLNDALKELGITDVFEGGLDDLATGPYDLYLSDAFQKARIEVDEEGTKAAAVTVLVVGTTSIFVPDTHFEMVCDRPFVYTISADVAGQQQILFVGAMRSAQ